MLDPKGIRDTYRYDILGRQTSDAIAVATSNPQNVDTSIVKHATSYNALGLPYQATSYNSSNAVVNQVQYGYNGFGQETIEYQAHGGSVNTSSSPNIQYAYVDGTCNTIRLTSQTFNNGRILDYGYNTGLDADISRVSYIADDGGTSAGVHLENYSYLGLDTVVKRAHPETGVDQTLIGSGTGDGGDQYVGLDRFGRVILQNWINGTTSSDEYEYAYDRNGNALYQKNDLSSVNSELYHANSSASGDNNSAYDTLNRLTGFRRGTLSSSSNNGSGLDTVSTLSTTFTDYQRTYSLDTLGNWSSLATDGGSAVSRTHNKKNQVTAVGTSSLTFDNDGNTTTDDQGQTFKYDAWNHIIQVKDNTSTTIVTYSYDANQRRITAVSPGTATRDLYFDTEWRIIEEYSNGTLNDQNIFTVNGYIDDVVLVDHDATTGGSYGKTSSGLDQRLYEMQDGQHRSTGLINTSGSVVERFQYDPYGNLTDMNASWGAATTGYAWEFLWKGMRLQTRDDIYYVRHRDYSPTLGRFLQEDPSGYSDGANMYGSYKDSPLTGFDPNGLNTGTITSNPNSDGTDDYIYNIKAPPSLKGKYKFMYITLQADFEATLVDDVSKYTKPPGGGSGPSVVGYDYTLYNAGNIQTGGNVSLVESPPFTAGTAQSVQDLMNHGRKSGPGWQVNFVTVNYDTLVEVLSSLDVDFKVTGGGISGTTYNAPQPFSANFQKLEISSHYLGLGLDVNRILGPSIPQEKNATVWDVGGRQNSILLYKAKHHITEYVRRDDKGNLVVSTFVNERNIYPPYE